MDEQITQKTNKKIKPFDIVLLSIFLVLISFIIFLTQFWVSLSIVDGDSMNQTLFDGDILITDMLKSPKRSDIVVFKHNESENFIKRVIAVEGDTVYNDENGNVWLKKAGESKASILVENYLVEGTKTEIEFYCEVKKDEFFVLGDNRGNSQDSRFFGVIKREQITGVVSEFWVKNKEITTKFFAFRRNVWRIFTIINS